MMKKIALSLLILLLLALVGVGIWYAREEGFSLKNSAAALSPGEDAASGEIASGDDSNAGSDSSISTFVAHPDSGSDSELDSGSDSDSAASFTQNVGAGAAGDTIGDDLPELDELPPALHSQPTLHETGGEISSDTSDGLSTPPTLSAYPPFSPSATQSSAPHPAPNSAPASALMPQPVPTSADSAGSNSNGEGYITVIDEVEVPAEESGVLVSLPIKEGDAVQKGMELARIDDAQVQMAVRVAQAKLDSAEKQAENDVNIRYAKAATDVAAQEIVQARTANERTPNTVTLAELRRLQLAHKQATLQIEQAEHDFIVAKFSVQVQEAELDAAKLNVQKKIICAPIDGVVVERFRQAGEWVKPGDPLLKIMNLEKVRIKFVVSASVPQSQLMGQEVVVSAPGHSSETFRGIVTFIDPNIDQGMNYQVWAEIQNRQQDGFWILKPGMAARAELKSTK
ncbi:MAG: efflux RND transporter periplasmic adaptor subunit [Planctomycetia bacterium]|nr:efflux RND transporter periplasmic adaptor subunit [Planctomycetia bacterium]